MARPRKNTNQVISDITFGIEAGLTLKAACKYAGVSYSSLANWMYKGKQARLRGEINQYTDILDKIKHETRVIQLQRRERFFVNLSPRDFRYGWSSTISRETSNKIER